MYSGSFKCHVPHRTAGSSLSTTSRRKLRSPSLCSAAPQKHIQNHFGLPLALSPGFPSRYKTQNRSPGLRHLAQCGVALALSPGFPSHYKTQNRSPGLRHLAQCGVALVLSPGFPSHYKTQNRSPGLRLVPHHTTRPA